MKAIAATIFGTLICSSTCNSSKIMMMIMMGKAMATRRAATVGGVRAGAGAGSVAFMTNINSCTRQQVGNIRDKNTSKRRERRTFFSEPQVTPSPPQSPFLDQVEQTIQRVFEKHNIQTTTSTSSSSSSLPQHSLKIDPSVVQGIHPPGDREAVGTAINLHNRISNALTKNGGCRRCWLQRAHCICSHTPPFEELNSDLESVKDVYSGATTTMMTRTPRSLGSIFILMHHKEIGMAVDTSKLLLSSFPKSCRLIINGIDPGAYDNQHGDDVSSSSSHDKHSDNYQDSMNEFNDAIQQKERKCMVLFPSDDATTYRELLREKMILKEESEEGKTATRSQNCNKDPRDDKWDLIVIDGTWSQARKMYSRYIPKEEDGGPLRVCLSKDAVDLLGSNSNNSSSNQTNSSSSDGEQDFVRNHSGRQLRRHPIKWREVSTLEATRLLIRDVMIEEEMEEQRQRFGEEKNLGEQVETDIITPLYEEDDKPPKCYDILAKYQQISDAAARVQLGPPRFKENVHIQ